MFVAGDKVRSTASSLVVMDDENKAIGSVSTGYAGTIGGSSRLAVIDGQQCVLWRVTWKWKLASTGHDVALGSAQSLDGWSKEVWLLSDDVYWLAKTIVSEAGGRPELEKEAVGYSLLNRRSRPTYFHRSSSSEEGVLQQLAVAGYDGVRKIPSPKPDSSSIDIAKRLLSTSPPADPTGGADTYFSPSAMHTLPPTPSGLRPVPGTGLTSYYPYWAKPYGAKGWDLLSSEMSSYVTEDGDGNRSSGSLYWKPVPGCDVYHFMFYYHYTQALKAQLGSAAELRVVDSQGRVSGMVDGVAVIEIPGSSCTATTVLIPNPSGVYTYVVEGTGDGEYALTVTATTVDGDVIFQAQDMPTSRGSVHQYSINWETLREGGGGVRLVTDNDGDGSFEGSVTTGAELDGVDLPGASAELASLSCGPNPIRGDGAVFFYTLPGMTISGTLVLFDITGRQVLEIPIEPGTVRYPNAGTWDPVDTLGVPLANGPYVCVLVADGHVIAQVKLVIQR
jgi:hypothetical protein